jgi:hypothetical protein
MPALWRPAPITTVLCETEEIIFGWQHDVEIVSCSVVEIVLTILNAPEADAGDRLLELPHGLPKHVAPRTVDAMLLAILDQIRDLNSKFFGVMRRSLRPWLWMIASLHTTYARMTPDVFLRAIIKQISGCHFIMSTTTWELPTRPALRVGHIAVGCTCIALRTSGCHHSLKNAGCRTTARGSRAHAIVIEVNATRQASRRCHATVYEELLIQDMLLLCVLPPF